MKQSRLALLALALVLILVAYVELTGSGVEPLLSTRNCPVGPPFPSPLPSWCERSGPEPVTPYLTHPNVYPTAR